MDKKTPNIPSASHTHWNKGGINKCFQREKYFLQI